ncbi:MAG: decarboxylase [Actinobacteria bacterium]|uniref:Unannotated protein n=1 Tax=freshwater metagenome TaxID=449393 RepID=A0A6J7LBT7_9ZZZZ|nr:decarboxylase [Actinomycetota bacterium]
MKQSDAPLVDAVRLARSQGRHPLLVPGHKMQYAQNSEVIGYDLLHDLVRDDVSLQGGADDLAMTTKVLESAESLYAAAIGADHTRFLVGGSTQANISSLLTISQPDRLVAVDRTSHRSALAGLVLSGAMPEWIFPEVHADYGVPVGVRPSSVAALSSDVTAVWVTSPSYVGTLSDIAALAEAAHALGVPLMVDQAWGAHLDYLPGSGALALGADIAVTSIHKALMGYSATAIVSCRGGLIDPHRLDRSVDLTATTSPSATLLASIDATRHVMLTDGVAALARVAAATAEARDIVRRVAGVVVIDESSVGCPVDPNKLTLWLPETGVTGTMLSDALWQRRIGVEAADSDTIVMTMSPVDSSEWIVDVARMVAALIESMRGRPRTPAPVATWQVRPEVVMSPREAMFAPRRRISLREAVGQVSAEQFCPYPPGVPLLGPGERVTEALVDAIGVAGTLGRVAYCSDPTLATIEVVNQ